MKPTHRSRIARETVRHLRADRQPPGPERAVPGAAGPVVQAPEPDALPGARQRDQGRARHRREVMNRLLETIREGFHKGGIHASVTGREKTVYSVYKKMREKRYTFSQVFDIYGVRVLVNDPTACYAALGVLHSLYKPIPGKFQGLRRDPEGERLPVAAHDAVRPLRHAARGADPHPRHAPRRRSRRRRALAVQDARGRRPRRGAARDAALAAEPARDPVGVARQQGVPREHQGRPLPRRDLRVHAEGQDHGAAARPRPRSTSPTGCTPTSGTTASRRASTTSSCRCAPS